MLWLTVSLVYRFEFDIPVNRKYQTYRRYRQYRKYETYRKYRIYYTMLFHIFLNGTQFSKDLGLKSLIYHINIHILCIT